jgi:hypothetical protein
MAMVEAILTEKRHSLRLIANSREKAAKSFQNMEVSLESKDHKDGTEICVRWQAIKFIQSLPN